MSSSPTLTPPSSSFSHLNISTLETMPYISSPPSSTNTDTQLMPPPSSRIPTHIRIKNRRKLYLDAHPDYFKSPDLELADPLLYDICVRKFQSPAEREADGRKKGYSGVLEADLWRSEAKISALQNSSSSITSSPSRPSQSEVALPYVTPPRDPSGRFLQEEEDPKTKEEGWERWRYAMTLRFLRGEDQDFEYEAVDGNEEWDWVERREREEEWFDEEEADEVGGSGVQDF